MLSTGVATSIGSLPHTDPDAAATVVLERNPELPAAPQLPARSAREGMIAQSAHGIHGVAVLDARVESNSGIHERARGGSPGSGA